MNDFSVEIALSGSRRSCSEMKLVRVVVREDFSRSRCEDFIRDLDSKLSWLEIDLSCKLTQCYSHYK